MSNTDIVDMKTDGVLASGTQVGFIGLGQMGIFMAANLAKYLTQCDLPCLHVWNRSVEKSQALSRLVDVAIVASPQDMVQQCDIVFTSLAHDQAVLDVYQQIYQGLNKDRKVYLVETSTVSPGTIQSLVDTFKSTQAIVLSCPVFGAPIAAQQAQLIALLSGGSAQDRAYLSKLWELSMAKKGQIDLGDDPTLGAKLKLCGNGFIASLIEISAEGLALAEASGVGQDAFLAFLRLFLPVPAVHLYANRMARSAFINEVGFKVSLGMKDLRHVRVLAETSGAAIPTVDAAFRHLVIAKKLNQDDQRTQESGQEWDWSAMIAALRVQANLAPTGSSHSDKTAP